MEDDPLEPADWLTHQSRGIRQLNAGFILRQE
jgi:hypothetical protein